MEHVRASRSEAEAAAAGWLQELVTKGRHDWRFTTPASVECQPVPELPCRVFSFAEQTEDGFVPCFGLVAGYKHRGDSWQYTTVDPETRHPLAPEMALSEIETVIDILIPTSLTSVPGPAA
ncbi:MAG: hypothetical protein OXN93_06765 [bacterium]|nr:hypothetical protein [bacterium]